MVDGDGQQFRVWPVHLPHAVVAGLLLNIVDGFLLQHHLPSGGVKERSRLNLHLLSAEPVDQIDGVGDAVPECLDGHISHVMLYPIALADDAVHLLEVKPDTDQLEAFLNTVVVDRLVALGGPRSLAVLPR